jgi:hypothetical protein
VLPGHFEAMGIRFLSGRTFQRLGVSATDPTTFAGVPALLLAVAVAVVASFFPARRASRVDPDVALRDG